MDIDWGWVLCGLVGKVWDVSERWVSIRKDTLFQVSGFLYGFPKFAEHEFRIGTFWGNTLLWEQKYGRFWNGRLSYVGHEILYHINDNLRLLPFVLFCCLDLLVLQ